MSERIETNLEAVTKHEETLKVLFANRELLIVVNERQQTVIKRLDIINGTVQDYNQNKYRIDAAENGITTICNKLTAHEVEHTRLDDRYINTKAFKLILKVVTVLGTILGIIISANIVLQFLKII